jgi:hypothetical protein
MYYIISLWLPIIASAVFVFVLSSIIHMVLKYHAGDYQPLPDEKKVLDALRPFTVPPGEYSFPYAADSKEMGSSQYLEKLKNGPVGMVTFFKNEPFNMGKQLLTWFIYLLVVALFSGYISLVALGKSADSIMVFRVVSTTAFMGFGLALTQDAIWYGRSWKTTGKNLFDALLYALVTGGTFCWLWPV